MAEPACRGVPRVLAGSPGWSFAGFASRFESVAGRDPGPPWFRKRSTSFSASATGAQLTQTYSGQARYYADHWIGTFRLLVAVQCIVGSISQSVVALLDPGSEWC